MQRFLRQARVQRLLGLAPLSEAPEGYRLRTQVMQAAADWLDQYLRKP